MASVGMQLLASIVGNCSVEDFIALELPEDIFKPTEAEVFIYLKEHVKTYGAVPQKETVEATLGIELPKAAEPPAYYVDEVEKRHLTSVISKTMVTANDLLKNMAPKEALALMSTMVVDQMVRGHKKLIVDFRDSYDPITTEYQKKLTMGDDYGVMFGWPYLDNITGGLFGGDVVSYVGRPAMGKTFKILKSAHHVWYTQRKPVLLISMEMKPFLLQQRLVAMHVHKNLTQLKMASYSTKTYNKVKAALLDIKGFDEPLWIVDGKMSATVEDIWMLCQQLKPAVVYVDGAYLLKHPGMIRKMDRISKTAEDIKDAATDLNLPFVNSYQLNREAAKKIKKDEEIGLEDIAGADDIGQLSSVVLGLLEHESVETLQRRWVTVLKGRGGETGGFPINWDFQFMNFDEYKEFQGGVLDVA